MVSSCFSLLQLYFIMNTEHNERVVDIVGVTEITIRANYKKRAEEPFRDIHP
jgi:hypothetical protein